MSDFRVDFNGLKYDHFKSSDISAMNLMMTTPLYTKVGHLSAYNLICSSISVMISPNLQSPSTSA